MPLSIDTALLERLYRRAKAERWRLAPSPFGAALAASAARAFGGGMPGARELERYLESLHLQDLALACACAAGDESAWEEFVREQRPLLYRAAAQMDPVGRGRELADSLYGDLYGLHERGGERQSLFRYYHGRSSLTTWLRAVLAQRHIDRVRAERRLDPLPEEASPAALASPFSAPDPDRERYAALIKDALVVAISRLQARDRLRLNCYYAQQLTLAQIGRLLNEHEATVSRHLSRTRRAVRDDIEGQLRTDKRLTEEEVTACFESVVDDAGPLDLAEVFGTTARKERAPDRSVEKGRRERQA